ncbi:hypothetical protein PHLCEN_2v4248 [Hermanssonia centrifuga]|uniref:NAD(P)-binding protein n=1 Tax=Hermanssonia centrifuga TaxID=98765 RepID=A0A2R6PYW5_9APHY|nr:hypothetical protein PHLCEN_2v4248 [Hermanssonia centrifuga]
MGKMPFSTLFIDQWTRLPPALQADLSGKSVMVTGANVGIGYETAKHFASLQPKRLVLACRDEKKGRDAIVAIEKETGYEGIELGILDQSKFSSVLEFARRFGDEPLDVLVANAGVLPQKFETTEDGWETALQVNHLSTALLSFLLIPTLVRTARSHNHNLTETTDGTAGKDPTFSRLVIVSSDVHFWTSFAKEQYQAEAGLLKTLNGQTDGHIAKRYFDSKCTFTPTEQPFPH